MEIIGSPFKGGYWFTLILFAYFYMYSIGDYLLSVLRFNTKQRLMVLFATSLIIYVLCTNPVLVGGRMAHILSLSQFRYFCFFVFGTIVKFQYDKVKDLFKNNYVSTSIVLGFLISTLIAETVRINSEWVMQTLKFIQSYCGVLLVFMFFEKNQNWCSKDTKIATICREKNLRYILDTLFLFTKPLVLYRWKSYIKFLHLSLYGHSCPNNVYCNQQSSQMQRFSHRMAFRKKKEKHSIK